MRNLTALLLCVLFAGAVASASSEKIIWNFSGTNGDGSSPWSNYFVSDGKGNLYGATSSGGTNSTGVIFMLSPKSGGGYKQTIIYEFGPTGSGDGNNPYATVALDGNGNMYGTTSQGGANGAGSVFEISPKRGGGWTEKVIYSFGASGTDGAAPAATVVIGHDGSLYGTTSGGGANGVGAVYKVSKNKSGTWTEKVIHSFVFGSSDGSFPYDGLMMDAKGDLYGTAPSGGTAGYGVVYKMVHSSKGWTESLIYSFQGGNDGAGMYYITPISDAAGNLYGATSFGGANSNGTVWELVYSKSKKTYKEKVLYTFGASGSGDGNYPYGGLAMDAKGNLYGTTENGGANNFGTVYRLANSGGKWKEKILHSFAGGTDGVDPSGTPLLDSTGRVYGMAQSGGTDGFGIAYRVTP